MNMKEIKTVSRRLIEDVFNQGRYEEIDDLLARDFVVHSGGTDQGREEFAGMIRAYRGGLPDYHCTIDDPIAEADRVVTRWTVRGTQTAELIGIPATGRPVILTGVAIDRVVDGKIVETWLEADVQRMLQDLGVVPAPQP
jgi:steroid delta-isomerase-like uncharacterized protein